MKEEYHIVSVPSPTFKGRRKQPGRLIFDPSTNRLGIFLCHCGSCGAKVITDKRTVAFMSKNINRSQKRWAARILMSAAKRLE